MISPKAERYYQLLQRQMDRLRAERQTLAQERAAQEDFAQMTLRLPPDMSVKVETLAGVPGRWLLPAKVRSFGTVLFLHGGAYQTGSSMTHLNLAAHLAQATGHRLWLPDYRLAPEHPFPAGLEDALASYQALQKDGPVALAGDSAGGGLALATALRLRDQQLPTVALALLSPWTDLTLSGDSHQSRAQVDPFFPTPEGLALAAERYAADYALDHVEISPLFADFRGLPPMQIHVGDYETLLDDSVALVRRAEQAGVTAHLEVWPQLWHVWQSYAGRLPEADASLAALGDFLSRQLLAGR
ncbi:hypothetical protein BGP77_07235 [Saccharospirillum sp. MSK14-1]|nr:hypothetical protein BGP77_07235 [Saccharospirillum sp. MSK14-1]